VTGDGHRPPHSLWYVLILAALTLYFLDIVARKLPPAEQWLGRLGRRLPQGRRAAGSRAGGGDGAGDGRPGVAVAAGDLPPGELYVARLRGRPAPGASNWTVRR
jgi:hypothetical protein